MTSNLLLALALTALQALDGLTTYHVIKLGGRETNKFLLWIQAQLMRLVPDERKTRYAMLLGSKLIAVALAWVLALVPIAHIRAEDIRLSLLLALGVLYVVIAAMNYNALCKLRERTK